MPVAVGSRGQAIPLTDMTSVPMLMRVISYDFTTSTLTCRSAWGPADSAQFSIRALVSKSTGVTGAGESCKLEEGDLVYAFRGKKNDVEGFADNPTELAWYSFILGSGINCEQPIIVSRIFVTSDCAEVAYDQALRDSQPLPVFDPDYPWKNYVFMDLRGISVGQRNPETGNFDRITRYWPVIVPHTAWIKQGGDPVSKVTFLAIVKELPAHPVYSNGANITRRPTQAGI
jgi:hypothetical protein